MVSEFEEREAAMLAGVPWHTWYELDRLERVGIVAHARVHNLVESHRADAVGADVKKRSAEISNKPGNRPPRGTFVDTFQGGRPNG